MTCGLILTDIGAAEIEAAYRAGYVVRIPVMAFGDGAGAPVELDPTVTELMGKLGEVPFIAGGVGPALLGGTAVIPCKDYPGKTLREVGLVSESGTLIAYGAYPETYLPEQTDQVIKELIIKFLMVLTHAESVELVIDPTIAILTIEEGDKRYYRQALCLQEVADAGADAQARARTNLGVLSLEESDNRFLNADENLADITDSAQARANLDVYSKEESDARYQPAESAYTKEESDTRFLNADANLSELTDKVQARNSLDIYSRGESDARYLGLSGAYTKAESDARYVQNTRLGALVSSGDIWGEWGDHFAPPGHVLVGFESGRNDDNVDIRNGWFKPLQCNINGVWVTIGG